MDSAIVISPGALTLFSLIISTLCGTIALLYRAGKNSDTQRIADLTADNKELRALAFRASGNTARTLTIAEVLAAAQAAGIPITEGQH